MGMAAGHDALAVSRRQWLYYQYKLQGFLPQPRYEHSLRVAKEAARLAAHYGLDEERARIAGLLHDVARDFNNRTLLNLAARFNLPVGPEERANPIILHAPLGAALLHSNWGLKDKAVLQAVSLHTLAAPDMDDFCQLIYLADIIEPGRKAWPGFASLRKLGYEHLGRAMLLALTQNFSYLRANNTFIHPQAAAAYDFCLQRFGEQESIKKR